MRKSYFHRGGAESLLGVTIPDRLADIVAKFPKREAVVSVAQGVRLASSARRRDGPARNR